MKQNKYCLLALCLMFILSACEKDPTIIKEDAQVEVSIYVDNVNFHSVDVYCQVEADISINKVVLQYSINSTMERADEVEMNMIVSYPSEAGFSKNYPVYHYHLKELSDATIYYCRIITENPISISTKDELQIITKSLAEMAVSTNDATDVTLNSATISGYVVNEESMNISERGFYYSMSEKLNDHIAIIAQKGSGSFSSTLENLNPNVKYYFTAYAIINGKVYKGTIKNFTTSSYTLAEVSTGDVKDITYNTATCSFMLSNFGNSNISEAGILYGRSQELDMDNAEKAKYEDINYKTNVSYESHLKNLESGSQYYYRAYATNNAGTVLGEVKTFTTQQVGTIYISTGKADPSYESVTIYYSIQTNGNAINEYGIIYDEENNYFYDLDYNDGHFIMKNTISYSTGQDINNLNQTFFIRNLVHATQYKYCTYVKYTDEAGNENILYGEIKTFETKAYKVPSVTTKEAKNITPTSAKLYMEVHYYIINTTQRGFYISSDPDAPYYTDFDNYFDFSWLWRTEIVGTSSGTYKTITGLTPNTTYYYIAWATNKGGNGYGEVMSFTTLAE